MMRKNIFIVLFILTVLHSKCTHSLKAGEIVENWAVSLGQELWDLARNITNVMQIKANYTSNHAQIERKDPEKLVNDTVNNLTKMFKRKLDTIRCIQKAAEVTAETYTYNSTDTEFQYYNSKYSPTNDTDPELPESILGNRFMYLNMTLTNDTHFYNLAVNTEHSVVQVPVNIYDRSEAAQTFIEWSENLDDIFIQNYNSDPALSWQYFCSSSGVLRHYPAMHWNQEIDLFDCRTRSWFIEAATCSKDVVILIDNSGSMTGMWNTLARSTVSKILDTFSNNDFINILHYSNDVSLVVPCFNNTLVQATNENIDIFKKYLGELEPDGYANLGIAMTQAFKILNESREWNDEEETFIPRSQAIMVVTDGVPNNVTDVFEKYNWIDNRTTILVRVFTYLIGREVSNIEEITGMACLNKGYFAHIRSLDEVAEKVLTYIPVIARPLVLTGEHPTSWTHAYLSDDSFADDKEDLDNYRLLTSVTVPAYDLLKNRNNETKMAELLGVAGTDVSIEDIEKLTLPYKVGVNGYAFIVTNNGYLLMHPNLRPMYEGRLNINYNSVDLSEVEFLDDNREPRDLNDIILELREALVNHSRGNMLGLPMKHFYDNMKRAYKETYDFYYAPLPGTPFSLGVALPQSHGYYWLKVSDEIDKLQHLKINISKFFDDANWKIHPKWVYCKYHYTEGHEFPTPEKELQHFLEKITEESFTWPPSQYVEEEFTAEEVDDEEVECGRKSLDYDDYYCDEELMQRLIFDAKIMDEAFMPMDLNETLINLYGATLKYVATMSGLTRWRYIVQENNDTAKNFGKTHFRAIDEIWYKSAVLQHQVDPDSFVYSISDEGKPRMIMASYAVFPRDAGTEAPGCVVGFKFKHSLLNDRFENFTQMNLAECEDCKDEDWNKDITDIYVIDHHGYIVLAKSNKLVGKFFGEVEGNVMDAMILNNTFENVTVYDFQAVCVEEIEASASNILLSPFQFLYWLVQWFVNRSMYLFFETSLNQIWADMLASAAAYYDEDDDYDQTTERVLTTPKPTRKLRKGQNQEEEDYFRAIREKKPEKKNVSEPCDKSANLYILNQTKFIKRLAYTGEKKSDCSRPYYAKRVPHSNLLLVVVRTNTDSCNIKYSAAKTEIIYENVTAPCHKMRLNTLYRRKLSGCYVSHPLEEEIDDCGKSSVVIINIKVLLFCLNLLWILNIYIR